MSDARLLQPMWPFQNTWSRAGVHRKIPEPSNIVGVQLPEPEVEGAPRYGFARVGLLR